MLISALKDYIKTMPAAQFTKTWTAIEKVEAAMREAGSLEVVVLEYARLKQAERVGVTMKGMLGQIAGMQEALTAEGRNLAAALGREGRLAAELGKAQKRIAKLKKKSK